MVVLVNLTLLRLIGSIFHYGADISTNKHMGSPPADWYSALA
jgi:hypothetical protein